MIRVIGLLFIALVSCFTLGLKVHANTGIASMVDGLWHDVNSSDFTNGVMILAQDGDQIKMSHYVEYKGVAMVEYGTGTRIGNTIEVDVTVTRPIPGWVVEGKHRLQLSADGTKLEGHYYSSEGSGPLRFQRGGK
ncbi:hypothetical protein [Shewanella colwelliana]|uniref:hypothetical protein n=1 Tax=Shewanella colwelliana TaxID=23 RepID=UPI0022AF69AB|nr:hypothetical protein [Shewanella colwelliana]MCZ4338931.1 hypothetical protein [Shewanella colwelliana]